MKDFYVDCESSKRIFKRFPFKAKNKHDAWQKFLDEKGRPEDKKPPNFGFKNIFIRQC